MLIEWVENLPTIHSPLKRDYIPNAFLRLSNPGGIARSVFNELITSLQPLMTLPFSIDMMYEFKPQATSAISSPARSPVFFAMERRLPSLRHDSLESSGSDSVHQLKTHAETGQVFPVSPPIKHRHPSPGWLVKISDYIQKLHIY